MRFSLIKAQVCDKTVPECIIEQLNLVDQFSIVMNFFYKKNVELNSTFNSKPYFFRSMEQKQFLLYYTGGVNYKKGSIYRFPGEWMLIQCFVHDRANYSLSIPPMNSGKKHDLSVDGKKIKWSSNTSYNVTDLAYNDSGQYICGTTWSFKRGARRYVEGEERRYFLTVLKEGKTCFILKLNTEENVYFYKSCREPVCHV